jgi:hypothetical protein
MKVCSLQKLNNEGKSISKKEMYTVPSGPSKGLCVCYLQGECSPQTTPGVNFQIMTNLII